jgi:hypothetical protein
MAVRARVDTCGAIGPPVGPVAIVTCWGRIGTNGEPTPPTLLELAELTEGLVALLPGLVALPVGLVTLLARLVSLLPCLVPLAVGPVALVPCQLEVVLQGKDLGRRGKGVALVEQLAHPSRPRELPPRVPPVPAARPLRTHDTGGVETPQKRGLHPEELSRLAHGQRRIVLVVKLLESHCPHLPGTLVDAIKMDTVAYAIHNT